MSISDLESGSCRWMGSEKGSEVRCQGHSDLLEAASR